MILLGLLSDRPPEVVLPALEEIGADLKLEPLSVRSIEHLIRLEPQAAFIDGAEHPAQAWSVSRSLQERASRVPVVVVVERDTIERFPWQEVADELIYPGAPAAELRARLAMLRHRTGSGDGALTRLGPISLDTESYRATAAGRPLDLTYKEFELLRHLAARPGRVCTRSALLREVWGYDFYGGTRTVDVHVRRLRAKLGPE
ncbi:MAG TPA: response regulator transcription factor, partial [Actinomycetota bacterium]|nr:response regulator transcription factor [Actinomycetota bacterium]